jgi:GAF domain-containing protein/CheY-like chemotaxis protein
VQEGLASKLDMQAIFDLVGEKIRDMFNAQSVIISSFDHEKQLARLEYGFEDGQRVYDEELLPFSSLNKHLIATRQTVVINENSIAESKRYGLKVIEGTQAAKSMIFVPFGAGTRVNGYFSLQNTERENAFAESDVRLLQTLAGSMGIALENARLSEDIQNELSRQIQAKEREEQRRAILEKVITTGQQVTEVHDVRTTLVRIWHGVHDELGFDRLGLYLFNRERTSMDGTFGTNDQGEMIDEWQSSISLQTDMQAARFFRRIIEKPDTILLTHTYESDYNIPEGHIMSGVQDFAAIGAWAGTKPVAVICVDHKITGRRITDEQLEALRLFAGYAGLAIENARLFDETQRLLKETEQRAAELSIINSVQQGLASKLEMQAIYDLVGDKIREIFDVSTVAVARFEYDPDIVHYYYVISNRQRVELESAPFTPLGYRLVTTRQPIVINQNFVEKMQEYGYPILESSWRPKSFLAVPMIVGDRVQGFVSLQDFEREHAFNEADLRLLMTLTNSMSVALENARLFDETQRLLKETKQRNAELAIINNISQALASELDLQAVIDLVGDRLLEVFHTQDAFICLYDRSSNLLEFPYSYTRGVRDDQKPIPFGRGLTSHVVTTRLPLVINQDFQRSAVELGVFIRDKRDLTVKAWIGVPIIVSDQVIGVIGLLSLERENAFSDLDVRLLETLASNMGVAIQNARLFQAEKQRATELAAISTVTQALVAETELDNMIQLVGSQTRQTFQADIAYVALLDPQTNTIRFPYQHGEDFTTLQLGEGLTSKIIQSGQPLVINKDIKERRAQLGTALVGREALSYLGVPIKAGKDILGVLSVQSVTEEGAFDDNDLRLLVTIAANAGAAIQTAQLHAETQRRAREMATLAEVGRDISSSLEASTVLEGIAKHAKELLNSNLSALFIPEGDGTIFRAIAAVGEEAEQVRNDIIRMGEGVLGDLARRRVGEIINDTNADPRTLLIHGTQEVPDEHLLAVPLLANEELKGLMAVWRTGKGKEFVEAELEFLNNMARQAVIAIQNTQLFEEAKEARAAAEQANKAKSTFLANMSHELRTPLNAIIGFTRIVRKKSDSVLPQKQLENLDKVLASSEHLLGLINTVLDIAKIEAGRMDVIPGNFSIGALADLCVNLATPLLKLGVILEKQVDVNLGIIYSDQDKIKQIVLNLLSNAAKFTHEGQIALIVEQCDEDTLRISVADSGIGISPEALSRIFDEFQQADASTTRQYGGTGLGLAISRNLARLLGGDLTATSELDKGSTFSLTIPMYYGRKATPALKPKSDSVQQTGSYSQIDSAKKRVLVIDDDPDAAYLLQESLSQNEFAVIGAPNGYAGLQLARDIQPDAILLDILMPETDGWQVLNDLKMDKTTVDIPVILLTIVDKKALGFKLGAAAYLLKPLNPTMVLEALRRVIGEQKQPHKQVLVVDDDPDVAEMLRQTLPESDFVLDSAQDGEAGLLAIEARRPDVILLDLMMPKLDGFGVIERLRADPDLRNIPIIVISAKDLTEEESKTLKESVAFVMKKQGFDGDLLIEEINSVVKR